MKMLKLVCGHSRIDNIKKIKKIINNICQQLKQLDVAQIDNKIRGIRILVEKLPLIMLIQSQEKKSTDEHHMLWLGCKGLQRQAIACYCLSFSQSGLSANVSH